MSKRKKIALLLASCSVLTLAAIGFARAMIAKEAAPFVTAQISDLPFCRTAVVLGCSRSLSNGRPNQFFQNRIAKAAELYHSRRVSKLIVSGDNSRSSYNEPQDMKSALVELGVAAEDIVCDYAGFSTLDSIVRAKQIFGQTQFIVISQEFHNLRAVFIARSKGIEAYGLNAPNVSRANSARTLLREELAKVKSVVDIWILNRQPKFLGPTFAI